MKKSLLKILSILFSGFFFFSCSNILGSGSADSGTASEKVNISGKIGITGAVPDDFLRLSSLNDRVERTALPSISSSCEYFFKVLDLSTGQSDPDFTFSVENGEYILALSLGKAYSITGGITSNSTHSDFLLSSSWETPVISRQNAASLGKDIILEPDSDGKGSVNLSITTDSKIKSVSCDNNNFEITGSGTSWSLKNKNSDPENPGIDSGSYSVIISFYDDDSVLLFSNRQIINVFSGFETGTWQSGGGSVDPIDATGAYKVTASLIEKFVRSQIYVGSTSYGEASASGNGSSKAPYATFQKAVEYIENNGDASVDYTIWISGEIKENASLTTSVNSKAHSITISGTSGNTSDSLNGNNSGSVLTISTSVSVTILNLTITEGMDSGIKITNSSAEVTLGTGAVITKNDNTVATNGGGIYNSGTLKILDGAFISDNHADSGKGGGIYNYFGTVIMEGGEISGNSANYGGGIYNYKEGDTITHDVIFEMKGGKVSGNTATNGGGAVYNEDIIKLSGSAYIPAGSNNSNDVYLIANKTINITAGITASSPAVTITLPADCYKADYQVLDPSGDLTQYKKIRLSTTGPWELNSSGNLQYKIADALQTMSSVNVALSSDLTIVPHSSYEAGSFTNGGKRYALIVPEGKTLTLSAKSGSPVISPSVRCGGFIKVKGTLIIDGVTLSPGSASLHWDAIEIDENGTVELRSGSIEGFSCYGASYGAVHVYNGGSFIMSGGTIKNNSSHGGVTVASGGSFTISGGSITENTSSSGYGGGVTVESGATFTQTGGSVTGNTGGNSEILRK